MWFGIGAGIDTGIDLDIGVGIGQVRVPSSCDVIRREVT